MKTSPQNFHKIISIFWDVFHKVLLSCWNDLAWSAMVCCHNAQGYVQIGSPNPEPVGRCIERTVRHCIVTTKPGRPVIIMTVTWHFQYSLMNINSVLTKANGVLETRITYFWDTSLALGQSYYWPRSAEPGRWINKEPLSSTWIPSLIGNHIPSKVWIKWLIHSCWSLGIDKWLHATIHNGCNYIPMSGLKLIHVVS